MRPALDAYAAQLDKLNPADHHTMEPSWDFEGNYGDRTQRILPRMQEAAQREKQYGVNFNIDALRKQLISDLALQTRKYHVPADLHDQMVRHVNEMMTPQKLSREVERELQPGGNGNGQ